MDNELEREATVFNIDGNRWSVCLGNVANTPCDALKNFPEECPKTWNGVLHGTETTTVRREIDGGVYWCALAMPSTFFRGEYIPIEVVNDRKYRTAPPTQVCKGCSCGGPSHDAGTICGDQIMNYVTLSPRFESADNRPGINRPAWTKDAGVVRLLGEPNFHGQPNTRVWGENQTVITEAYYVERAFPWTVRGNEVLMVAPPGVSISGEQVWVRYEEATPDSCPWGGGQCLVDSPYANSLDTLIHAVTCMFCEED